jgi:hypothetical protein
VIADLLSTSQLAAYLDLNGTMLFTWQQHWAPALGLALQSGQPVYVVEEAAAATQGTQGVCVVFGQESACDRQHAIESWRPVRINFGLACMTPRPSPACLRCWPTAQPPNFV